MAKGLTRSLRKTRGAASLLGSEAVTGMTIEHSGDAAMRKTVFRFTDAAIALADAAGVVAYAGTKIFDAPEGLIVIIGASANLALTKSSAGVNADWDGDFSVGTVTASNNATLSSTEQNIIPTTPTAQAVAGATTAVGESTAPVTLDGTATAVDVYLNFLVDDTDHDVTGTPCNLIVNGTLTMIWTQVGDN